MTVFSGAQIGLTGREVAGRRQARLAVSRISPCRPVATLAAPPPAPAPSHVPKAASAPSAAAQVGFVSATTQILTKGFGSCSCFQSLILYYYQE